MTDSPTISTHVLDVEHGRPAAGIQVDLLHDGYSAGGGKTDSNGRIARLLDGDLLTGDYEITFNLTGPFYRTARFTFRVDDVSRSYHIPLLLSPFGLTSYRGS